MTEALADSVNNLEKAHQKAAKAKEFFDITFAREATAPALEAFLVPNKSAVLQIIENSTSALAP